jgi:glycosyltransferase involved in cell wall biosynthesis
VGGHGLQAEPRASVIVPVRNAAAFIPDQLEALRAQAARNALDVVVVDDASTDDTAEVVARWIAKEGSGRFRLVRRPVRGGPNAARNVGIGAAASDFLLFCDGDDIVADGWSGALLAARDDGAILCGALDCMSVDASPTEWALPPVESGSQYAYGGNMAVTRSIVDRLGGFDENILSGGSELDFALRAARDADAVVTTVPAARVRHRVPTSAGGRLAWQFEKERGRAYLRKKHGGQLLSRSFRNLAAEWGHLLLISWRGLTDRSARLEAGELAGRVLGRTFWSVLPRSVVVRPTRRT